MINFVHRYDVLAEHHFGSARALIFATGAALVLSVGCGGQSDDPLPNRPVTSGDDATSYSDGQEDGDTADAGGHADSESLADSEDLARSGDTCEAAIVVDLSSGSFVLEGDQQDYTTQWNAQGRQGCSLYEDEPAGPTEGPEIFLRLTGFEAGDEVLFDAEDGGSSYAFYIIEGCGAATCLDSGVHDDELNNRHTWQATAAADVWVAAEVFGPPRDRPFRIEIRRR